MMTIVLYRENSRRSTQCFNKSPLSQSQQSQSTVMKPQAKSGEITIGMHVLAFDINDRSYHPAIITKIGISNAKELYSVRFWNNSTSQLSRTKIHSKHDPEFFTCNLTESFDPDFHDGIGLGEDELAEEFNGLKQFLNDIYDGRSVECERYVMYKQGGRQRRLLMQRMGHGGFTVKQSEFLFKLLKSHFADSIGQEEANNSQPIKLLFEDDNEESLLAASALPSCKGLEQLNFLSSVLLPELMIQILMRQRGIGREEAEELLINGDDELEWAKRLIAYRQMFRSNHLLENGGASAGQLMDALLPVLQFPSP